MEFYWGIIVVIKELKFQGEDYEKYKEIGPKNLIYPPYQFKKTL